ncbi:MAG: hypothetical protein DCF12_20285 [Snowella sp.]|nr:MAG: hypothetical protein DCF12_20285 [Snowella sp.]
MLSSFEELQVKASQLQSCFYCSGLLPALQKEHIFNNAWGGSHKTGKLICNECNQNFSQKVDKALLCYTNIAMNAWSFEKKRQKSIPRIEFPGDYVLEGGGKPKLKKPGIQEERLDDGRIKTDISFNSSEEARNWLNGSGAKSWLGRELESEEKDNILKKIKQAQPQSRDISLGNFETSLDLSAQYRSAAHTILKCLGLFMPDLLCLDETKPIRQFVRYEEGNWQLFAVEIKQHISVADIYNHLAELGADCNSVEVYWCSHLKMVIGVLTLFNHVKRAVIISKEYSGTDKILYVFEDTRGSERPPQAFLVEINSQKFDEPIIGIQCFDDLHRSYQIFYNEISFLIKTYRPIATLTDDFIKTIGKISQKTLELDNNITLEYQTAFLNFFIDLGKLLGKSIDSQKVLSKISEYEFEDLIQKFSGNYDSIEFEKSLSEIWQSLLINEFEQGAFE